MPVSDHQVCRKFQNTAKESVKNYLVGGCETCERLQEEYERMECLYGQAILAMASAREEAMGNEYPRLRRITDEKRIDSEMARLQLKLHMQAHSKANQSGSASKPPGRVTLTATELPSRSAGGRRP